MISKDTSQIWLQSAAPGGANGLFDSIAMQLQAARIECLPYKAAEKANTVLFLIDDETSEEQEKERLREVLSPER
ncbi:MAG: hypothetical protein Q8K92_12350, partial [Leadbetterella sp.]|nr:hypothetical protein [Leadbetterella sp.]